MDQRRKNKMTNLIKNNEFSAIENSMPKHWNQKFPRENLKPFYNSMVSELAISGNGNEYAVGSWTQRVDIEADNYYRFKVIFKVENIEDINLNVFNVLFWLRNGSDEIVKDDEKINNFYQDKEKKETCTYDYISNFHREGELIIGEDLFYVPKGFKKVEIQLGLRFSESGKATWKYVELTKDKRPKSMPVRLTAVKWTTYQSKNKKDNLKELTAILDDAGYHGSDLVLLPEFSNKYTPDLPYKAFAETIEESDTCKIAREKAAQYRMNVCVNIVEKDNDLIFNSSILFNRDGNYVGKYRKTHPYWLEETVQGISPGDDYPVFDLDFGKVGMVTCYDCFFPETTRILALKGAEIILYANDGFERLLMPARAIDNRVYFVVSTVGRGDHVRWNMPAMIVDTSGNILCENGRNGIITTEVDLSYRTANLRILREINFGTMCTFPGGRRALRHAKSQLLYEEIEKEVKTWEDRPENFFRGK
ncbi:MAG: carbon-nitrogen hydrolase family protein [Bacteroidales bacterium]|nr:carbon-nitrogen hydrolase family protein [Bacteroidales bacterium]